MPPFVRGPPVALCLLPVPRVQRNNNVLQCKATVVSKFSLGFRHPRLVRNPAPAVLYERALQEDESHIVSTGALATRSGIKTGRSPKDKRIVEDPASQEDVWWGPVNIPLSSETYLRQRQRALEFLQREPQLYVVDGFAGWHERYRLKIRVICSRPYHALFMHNMLIRPTDRELLEFGSPDYVLYNAGQCPADESLPGMTSTTCVALDFSRGEMLILGTEYAGEMKKGVFSIMNYLMPKQGILSMHCSANEGADGDVSLFFGLSGTGKTTLSTDPRRQLIGDDEHCWTEKGVFNIEGGCYAKCIGLTREKEPEIFDAVRFGAVLENVVFDEQSRDVDYDDASITENTRAAYPIDFIPHAKTPGIGGHPSNIVLLTCDAFGVLPPVSRLTPTQAMYHFLNGYTAKVAGTEMGVREPQVTFSACFGAAFLVWHPQVYGRLLADKMRHHEAHAWLINTGWTAGPYGDGCRIPLQYTRAIIDAIHSGALAREKTVEQQPFGLHVPVACPGCPSSLLRVRETWSDAQHYDETAARLSRLFAENYAQYTTAAVAK
jgi:phosphoenolpyruvate carboxykinase (ATP)